MKKSAGSVAIITGMAALFASPASAHVGVHDVSSFAAGLGHPFSGLDHVAVMVAVGLWAALKGGRALWAWPLAFVVLMMAGGVLGMMHIPVPFVEPAILASVVAIGLLVALAVDLPLWVGAAIVGGFAVFHGHAHGSEVAENLNGAIYLVGFALATVMLHRLGLGAGFALAHSGRVMLVRAAGAACVVVGLALAAGVA